ncbi:ABC transporter substrate-binding protein [Streptomyces sp. NPDC050433]|uniref:ABC transporter substrate-binding protein n=1 Tax=Streptomyces sp. NPDC050433 TaxID=3365615 RepID=UPI0037AE57E9
MIVTLTLAASLALGACSGSGAPGGADGSSGPERAKEITIGIASDEGSLTPYTQVTGYPGANLVALVYDKLLERDAKNQPRPLLAEKVTANADSTVFTLPLRSGVKWHDGKPFTADDVVFSVDYYKKYNISDSAPQLDGVKGVTARGNSVEFQLAAADPEFALRVLADMRILPQHIWSSVRKPDAVGAAQAIGTGPYRLVSYKKNQGYVLRANPDYAMGTPKADEIKISVIPEQQTALAGLRTGEVSVSTRAVPAEQAKGLARQRGVKITEGPDFSSTLLAFNNRRKPFDDPRVRTAISLAIDTDKLVSTVMQGKAKPGSPGWLHPDAPGSSTSPKHTYDPAQAKTLLDRAGAEPAAGGVRAIDGKPMKFSLLVQSVTPQRIRAAELIRDMLKPVGIAVTVNSMDPDSLDAKVWPNYDVNRRRDYDMTMWGWSAPTQLDTISFGRVVSSDTSLGKLNITGTKDAQMDRLVGQLGKAETLDERYRIRAALQRRTVEITPFVTLYYPTGVYGYRKDVFDGWVYQAGTGILNKASFVEAKS